MANKKAVVATKATDKQGGTNPPAKVSKKANVKFTGPTSTPPKGAVPSKMKMGGSKSKKAC